MTKSTIDNKYNKEGIIWKSYHKGLLSQIESTYKLVSIIQQKNGTGIWIGHKNGNKNSSSKKCKLKDTEIPTILHSSD